MSVIRVLVIVFTLAVATLSLATFVGCACGGDVGAPTGFVLNGAIEFPVAAVEASVIASPGG